MEPVRPGHSGGGGGQLLWAQRPVTVMGNTQGPQGMEEMRTRKASNRKRKERDTNRGCGVINELYNVCREKKKNRKVMGENK